MFWLRHFIILISLVNTSHIMEEKLKILETNQKSEDITHFYPIFCALEDFYCNVVKRNVHVWLGCTKIRNPEISTVLHWRPPDIHIFHTDPSLICIVSYYVIYTCIWI